MEQTEQWVSAYLEWIDVSSQDAAVPARGVFVERRTGERRANGPGSREDVLLTALRAESDCVHMLRQALDSTRRSAAELH